MPGTHDAIPDLIVRYRAVLKAEASREALEETLTLVSDVSETSLEMPANDSLETFEPLLRQVRVSRGIDSQQRQMIYQIIAALTLPSFIRNINPKLSAKRMSLLIDTSQVLFHHAYFVLAAEPSVLSTAGRKILLNGFKRFAEHLPSRADSYRAFALVHDALQQPEVADLFRRQSLRETPSTADEYLTVLQTAWSGYVDRKLFALAMLLLLEEIRNDRISQSNFNEFLELVALTLEMWHGAKGATASTA